MRTRGIVGVVVLLGLALWLILPRAFAPPLSEPVALSPKSAADASLILDPALNAETTDPYSASDAVTPTVTDPVDASAKKVEATEESHAVVAFYCDAGCLERGFMVLLQLRSLWGYDRKIDCVLELDPELVRALNSTKLLSYSDSESVLKVERYGTQLLLQFEGLDDGLIRYSHDFADFVRLDFDPVPPGQYALQVADLYVEPPSDVVDGADGSFPFNWKSHDFDVVVGEPYVTFSGRDSPVVAYCAESYNQWFEQKHFCGNTLTFRVVGGELPPGVDVNSAMPMLHGTPEPGSAGNYPIEVEFVDEAGSRARLAFTIEVQDRRPRLESVKFRKEVGNEGIVPGDVLVLDFSEPIQNAASWRRSLEPALPGDDFGKARIEPGRWASEWLLVLGSGVRIQQPAMGSAVRVISGRGGIIDLDGNSLEEAELPIVEPRQQIPFRWTIGKPIEPVWLTHPPFPAPDIEITGLPDGLEFDGRVIHGTPRDTGTDYGHYEIHSKDGSSRRLWTLWERDFMAYQLYLDEKRHPGDMIQFELRSPLPDNQPTVRAWVGSAELVRLSGSFCSFILPDDARSGRLVVRQGPYRHDAGLLPVTPRQNPNPGTPWIESQWWFYEDTPGGDGRILIVDGAGLAGCRFKLSGIAAQPRVAGDTFAIIPVPAALDGMALDARAFAPGDSSAKDQTDQR